MVRLFKRYRAEYGINLSLSYPIIVSQLGHTLVALSDSLIAGHINSTALAAVSFGNAIFVVLLMLGVGISYGLTPLISQAAGKNDRNSCGMLLANSLLVNFVTGIFLFLFGAVAIKLLESFGQSAYVTALAKPFLSYLGFSILPLMIFLTFKQFAEGLGFTKQAMRISIAGNIINVFFGAGLAFGFLGPVLGVKGIGIANLIDRSLMSVAIAVYVLTTKHFKPYLASFGLSMASWLACRKILGIGFPIALQYLFEIGAFSFSAVIIGWTGPTNLAAHQIAISLASMTYMVASGLASAATIQAGNWFGRQNFENMRRSAYSSYHLVLAFMTFTALIFILFRRFLPTLYIEDAAVVGRAAELLSIAALFQLFDGLQVVGLGILRGMSDVRLPAVITFVAYWIVGLPLGYCFCFPLHMGAQGIWLGLFFGLGFSALALLRRFQHLIRFTDKTELKL